MNPFDTFDERPIVVALAGPNGAGKTTFYHAHLAAAGLRFVNADVLASELGINAAQAMATAAALRSALVRRRESFVIETVFSDPVGDKLSFLAGLPSQGYTVVLCYIGLASAEQSETLAILHAAIRQLPNVLVFDNSDLSRPFRLVAVYEHGDVIPYP